MAARRKLTIDVEVDNRGGVRALKKVEQGVKGVTQSAQTGTQQLGNMRGALKSVAGQMAAFGLAGGAVLAVASGMRFAVRAAIDMNASIEKATLQFETFTGSADSAESHVRSLFDFAKRTPFESGPIIEASRLMRTFGGAALDTQENLTLIGDASAATSAPINELGMWTGRLYAALQGGQPIGEATLRMMEMGVVTPQVVQKLRDMREAGAGGNEVFTVFQESLGKFTGSMAKQADTWEGLTSTFWENTKLYIADRSTPAFELLKVAVSEANQAFENNRQTVERNSRNWELLQNSINETSPVLAGMSKLIRENAGATALMSTELGRQFVAQAKLDEEVASYQLTLTSASDAVAEFQAAEAEAAAEAERSTQTIEEQKKAHEKAVKAAKAHADMLDSLSASEAALMVSTKNATMSLQDMLETLGRLADDVLPATALGADLVGVRVGVLGRDFSDMHRIITPPGGFFGAMLDSFNGLKAGLTGGNGLVGFFTKLGTGVVEGFGNIISGGLTSLVEGLVSYLTGKIGDFLSWIGGKIGGFFKWVGRGLQKLFGVGGNTHVPVIPGTPEHAELIEVQAGLPAQENPGSMSGGGLVPQYFGNGGAARGTDTVPAMLTPGEIVMSRPAVQRIGADRLLAMNAGRSAGGVNVTVNVQGGYMDSPITQRKLAGLVETQLLRALGQRRNVSGLV